MLQTAMQLIRNNGGVTLKARFSKRKAVELFSYTGYLSRAVKVPVGGRDGEPVSSLTSTRMSDVIYY